MSVFAASIELFDALAQAIETNIKNCDLYAYELAPEDAMCPYITLGYSREYSSLYKGEATGDVLFIIDIWHDRIDKREEYQRIISELSKICDGLKVEGHSVSLKSFELKTIIDTTTSTPYLHGSVSVVFLYS